MRRVALALFGTVSGLVMLLSFKTHTTTAARPVATSTTGPGTTTGGATAAPSSSAGTSSPKTPSAGSTTVTGDAIDTRYGPVQVQLTVTNGAVSAVTAIEYPQNNPRDEEINSYAIPQLNQEALAAKSAQIDMVSGATYTSNGYIGSLQSALDKAGL